MQQISIKTLNINVRFLQVFRYHQHKKTIFQTRKAITKRDSVVNLTFDADFKGAKNVCLFEILHVVYIDNFSKC